MFCEYKGNTELAHSIYQKIYKLYPNNVAANENLGLFYLTNRTIDKAEFHLTKAVQQDNNRWKSHNALGIISDLQDNYTAAISHYQSALAINPSSPLVLNNIGYSYYLSGQDTEAEKYFSRALGLNGAYKRAIDNLALLQVKHKRYSSAISLFNRVMEPYEAYNSVGYLCMLNKQYQQAEMYFNKAINASPFYYPKAIENLEALNDLQPDHTYVTGEADPSEIEEILIDDNLYETENDIYDEDADFIDSEIPATIESEHVAEDEENAVTTATDEPEMILTTEKKTLGKHLIIKQTPIIRL